MRSYRIHSVQAMRWRSLPIRLSLLFLFLSIVFSAALFPAKKKPPLKPVNLNTATSEELQQVPGIGPATAEKILQMRKSYGAFKSVDDLLAIRGIGKKRQYLTVGKPGTPKNMPPPAKPAPAAHKPPDKP